MRQMHSMAGRGLPKWDKESDRLVMQRFEALGYGVYGGASLSTMSPDPSVYSYGETDSGDGLLQANGAQSQWGSVIADVAASASSAYAANQRAQMTPAQLAAANPNTGSSSWILLLVVGGIILFLVMRD